MKKSMILITAVAVLSAFMCGCSDNTSDSSDSSKPDTTTNITETASRTETTPDVTAPATLPPEKTEDTDQVIGDSEDAPSALDTPRGDIVRTARSLIGIDYALGQQSPEYGFDNSGLIYYVLRENGFINCPRSTMGQIEMGGHIDIDEAQPGDVMFFSDVDTQTGEQNYFGGIYVGDGQLVYSPYPGEKVKYADINNSYWQECFYCAISVF